MTELEHRVQELEKQVASLQEDLANLRKDIFDNIITRDEVSAALNRLFVQMNDLQNKLNSLIWQLQTKGII